MTAFFSRCCRRLSFALLALFALAGAAAPAQADGIAVRDARLVANDDSYSLEANFDLALNSTLEDALSKGVSLYFVLEFEVIRKRWYWFVDEKIAERQLHYKLSFNGLTGQYRLGIGQLYQNFDSLGEALGTLAHVRRRQIIEPGVLKKDTTYIAAVRMRLDVSQLPRPFQLSAFGSRDWNISSDWHRWTVTP